MRALGYDLLKRMISLLLGLAGVATIIFAIPYFAPGGPERALVGWPFTAERATALRAHYGFDRPLLEQYALWVSNLVRGEWGRSKYTGRPIMRELEITLPLTLKLVAETVGIAVLIAALFATLAMRPGDRAYQERGQGIRVVAMGFPDFYFGILVKFFFVWHLEWFPIGGLTFFSERPWQAFRQLLLPALSVGLLYGMISGPRVASRLAAVAGMHEEGSSEGGFVRRGHVWGQFSKALGISLLVLSEHGGLLIGSMMLVEKIFAIPGFGDYGVEAFLRRDYPKVQAFLVVSVSAYFVLRVLVSGVEAMLERRALRNHFKLLFESPLKPNRGLGGLLMHDGFFFGMGLVVALAATTLFAGHVAPYLPDEVHMQDRLQPPKTQYWMGSDLLGRDMLSRVIHGGRYSLMVAALGATGALFLGVGLGGIPRLAGKVGIALATPMIQMLETFPTLMLGMLMMTLMGQGYLHEILALSVALAAQLAAVFLRLPIDNPARFPVPCGALVAAWLSALAMAIILEATLNFLDMGLLPLIPSWGGDLKANFPYLHVNPAIVLFPGIAVVMAALGFNLMAESVQKHAGGVRAS
ncbi:MAG: hypothetical protein HYZ81_24390 [Nitrospinae bacterium]|nr:hypothetical protein [Nitrospinota bacterium]